MVDTRAEVATALLVAFFGFTVTKEKRKFITIIPPVGIGYEMVRHAVSSCLYSTRIQQVRIIVLLETPTKYREFFLTLFVKTTDFQLVFNFEQTRTVTIFGGYGTMAHMPYEKYVFHLKSGRKLQDDRHVPL